MSETNIKHDHSLGLIRTTAQSKANSVSVKSSEISWCANWTMFFRTCKSSSSAIYTRNKQLLFYMPLLLLSTLAKTWQTKQCRKMSSLLNIQLRNLYDATNTMKFCTIRNYCPQWSCQNHYILLANWIQTAENCATENLKCTITYKNLSINMKDNCKKHFEFCTNL